MGAMDNFYRRMSSSIYTYVGRYLPFEFEDTGNDSYLRVEKVGDGGLRVVTVADYSTGTPTETVVNIPVEQIERLLAT